MMMNIDYTSIVANARTSGARSVNFNNTNPVKPIDPILSQQDTVTLSKLAPTYIKPETATALLAQNESVSPIDVDNSVKKFAFRKLCKIL